MSTTTDFDAYEYLRKRYCPPLEESLFIAIAGDYNLSDEKFREEFVEILHGLKEQALIEQDLELTAPIVTPAQGSAEQLNSKDAHTRTTGSLHDKGNFTSEESAESITTGFSNLKTASEELDRQETEDIGQQGRDFEIASYDDQTAFLHELFPSATSEQIVESLTKHRDDPQRCFDELLNLSFINEAGQAQLAPQVVARGVDGFAVQDGPGKRKGRSKKNRKRRDMDEYHYSDEALSSGQITPRSNIWQQSSEDVEFLASRTQMSIATAKSLYHEHGANLPMTIRALIDKESKTHSDQVKGDNVLHLQAQELKFELSWVSDSQIYGALLLTKRLPSAAKDLLEAMLTTTPQYLPPSKIVAQYTPVDLSEDDGKSTRSKPKASSFVPGDPMLLASRAGTHSLAANEAFEQASAAHRRGKSDKYYGGVAAYYAAEGHERRKRQRELLASAADALAHSQSGENMLDLHGVTVEHAVRITRDKVEAWWDGLGDRKYIVGGIGSGYKIITGVGTHSAQGIGRIGPAVTKMLMREGWKVNVRKGEVIVEGKARR